MTKKEFNQICKDNGLWEFATNDYEQMLNTLSLFKSYESKHSLELYNENNDRVWAKHNSERERKQSHNIYVELNNRGFYTR